MPNDAKQNKIRLWNHLFQTAAALALLVGIWLVAHAVIGNELLVPDFSVCMRSLWDILQSSAFWLGLLATLSRVGVSFLISFALALIFSIVAYLLPTFARFLSPFIALFRAVPTMAVLLIVLVWAGASGAPTVVACLSLTPILFTGISTALGNVSEENKMMSRVYKVPLRRQIRQLYLPSILPALIREGFAGLGYAIKLVVSAEVLASTYQSLGGMMGDAKLYYEMPTLFALVLVVFVLSLVLELVGSALSERAERRVR